MTFPESARFEGCHDQANFVPVPMDRAQARVPNDYKDKLSPYPTGEAELAISELRCDKVTIGQDSLPAPVSMAFANFTLTGAPDRSQDDPEEGDVYLLFFMTDSKPLANWLRAGTNLEAFYVPDIIYSYTILEPFGEAPFFFQSPAPPKWAFTVEGVAGVQRLAPVEIGASAVWQDTQTPDGKTWRVKLAVSEHFNFLAPADVTIRTPADSELDEIFGPGPDTAKDPFAVSGLIDDWDVEKTRTIVAGS